MRFSFALLLATIVALSSVAMAAARHQPFGVDRVTLCTEFGLTEVTLDAQGNPLGPMPPCLDCTAPVLAAPPGAAGLAPPWLRLVPVSQQHKIATPPDLGAPGFHWSRGPPVRV